MTAAAVVDQVRLGDHVCWTYDDEAGSLDAVGRFVTAGLRLGVAGFRPTLRRLLDLVADGTRPGAAGIRA